MIFRRAAHAGHSGPSLARVATTAVLILLVSAKSFGEYISCEGSKSGGLSHHYNRCFIISGQQIADAIRRGDSTALTAMIDRQNLARRAVWRLQGNPSLLDQLRTQLDEALVGIGQEIVTLAGQTPRPVFASNDPDLANLKYDVGCLWLPIRIQRGRQSPRYMEFITCIKEFSSVDGWRYIVVDFYDWSRGQNYSESLGLALASTLPNQASFYEEVFGVSKVDAAAEGKFRQLGKLSLQGSWREWLEVYRTLPKPAQTSRALLIGRRSAALAIGDHREYAGALTDLNTFHHDDATVSLFLLDYHFLREDFHAAQASVDRLEAATGDGPAATDLRASIALRQREYAQAIEFARRAISLDQNYERPYWSLVEAATLARDFEAAMEGVSGLRQHFGYALSSVELLEHGDYRDLVQSNFWRNQN